MKKIILFSLMLVSILMIVSCALSPEEAENQAAQALEQLSDDELQQLEDETAKVGEGMAIAGQGYQIPRGATINVQQAAWALQNVNRNTRLTIVQQERERRTAGLVSADILVQTRISSTGNRPGDRCEISIPGDCPTGFFCSYDITIEHTTCQPPGGQDDPCRSSYGGPHCKEGLFCIYDFVRDHPTCQAPYLGSLCEIHDPRQTYLSPSLNSDACESIGLVCGWDGTYFVCESPNQPDGSTCHLNNECASDKCERQCPDRPGPPANYRTNDCTLSPRCVRTIE